MVKRNHLIICKLKNTFIALLCFLLIGCMWKHEEDLSNVDTANLKQLQSIQVRLPKPGAKQTSMSGIRVKMLQDIAMSIGAQGGLAWASEQLNARLDQDSKYLDNIFNFNAMMLTHGVLPPVLEEGDFSLNLADPNTIRVADRTYKIVQQARFATTPPNWREYLRLTYAKPTLPNRTLLPKNKKEHAVWKRGVETGWQKGIEQAYSIFQQSLARLKRDFRGMVIYRKLLQEKMISQPFVARTELGVTGDGSDMRINDQVLRIVELPQLQTNSRNWRAIVVKRKD